MERIVSAEERLRRAEEIYYRRRAQGVRVDSTSVNVGNAKKVSLGKKMCIQILVCVVIYTTFWFLKEYNTIFSENVINQTKTILNYDINFQELYNLFMEYFNDNFNNIIKDIHNDNEEEENKKNDDNEQSGENNGNTNGGENGDSGISNNEEGNSEYNNMSDNENNGEKSNSENSNAENSNENINNSENNSIENINEYNTNNNNGQSENSQNIDAVVNEGTSKNTINDGTIKAKQDAENKTQMEQDAEYIKQNYNLIQPIKGVVTSQFGGREETEIISAFHQGIDIAANTGTQICAAMEGTVIASSYAGEYGNHIKIQNGEVMTVYAHCSALDVKVGDYVQQNQEIGKVGATGKVTGSHLHFEIRRNGRYVNPEMVLSF